MIGEWINAWINLGIRAGEGLAHNRHYFLLASHSVCDDLLFQGLLGLACCSTRGRLRYSVCVELAQILVLVLYSFILDVFVKN